MYKRIASLHKVNSEEAKELKRQRLILWRRQNALTRIERPTKLDRARRLGYKPKQGIVLVRARVARGGRRLSKPTKGRRSKRQGVNRITANIPRQVIAENRVARRYPNMEVLNSYEVGKDGRSLYYEVILVDPAHPVIKSDKNLNWLSPRQNEDGTTSRHHRHRGRSFRGLTSAAKKARGLRNRGTGAEHVR